MNVGGQRVVRRVWFGTGNVASVFRPIQQPIARDTNNSNDKEHILYLCTCLIGFFFSALIELTVVLFA